MTVNPRDLFDTDDPAGLVEQLEQYKDILRKTLANPIPNGMNPEQARMHKAVTSAVAQRRPSGQLNKAVDRDLIGSVERELAHAGGWVGLGKGLDLAGPGTTDGLHTYDLEGPAKNLVPRKTPLRNRIARRQGVGVAHEYKRITGFSNAGVAGVPNLHPGQAETDTVAFGTQNFRRGKIIQYAGDHITVPYRKFALSDSASWDAVNAGKGFEDLRQLSSTSTLYSIMLAEERMLLAGRGLAAGFSGAVATPGTVTVTTPVAGGSQTAVTGAGANVYVSITATTMWGETALSAVGNSAFTAGDVVVAAWAQVPGATGYRIFVGTGSSAPATSATWLATTTAANTVTLQGALPTSGTAASTLVSANTPTAFDSGYDGILSYVLDPSKSGYLQYINGPLTSDDPFQDAFAKMFDDRQADSDTILCNGHDRRTLSDILKNSSSSNYRIMLSNGSDGTVGALAVAVQNEVTGSMVELSVHPFMPRGVMPIVSWQLPLPDSNISDCWAVVNTQDYQGVSWPVIEFTYDFSVYFQGTFCAYAPEWSGAIAGITG